MMGSKAKLTRRTPISQLLQPGGFSIVFKAHGIALCLYVVVLVIFMVASFGNILHIGATIPWHVALFHLFSARNHPHPLPDCHLVNGSRFGKALMTYVQKNSGEYAWRQDYRDILQKNEWRLTWSNKKLVILARKNASDVALVHPIFRDILFTRTNQSNYKAETMQSLLPNVKRQMDWHYQKSIKNHTQIDVKSLHGDGTTSPPVDRYESCAIVGNSGVLRNSERGPEIDRHEMVIRLNNAINLHNRNKTFLEEHIGTKTTMTFMNSHILQACLKKFHRCNCHPYGVEVPIMVYLCIPEHALGVACCAFEHETPIFLTDGRFDAFVSRVATWYSLRHFLDSGKGNITQWEDAHKHEFHYSSGFQAVITALALCEKVDLYGFGKHPKARHHFHSFQPREHYHHDFEGEYLFYDDLEANRIYENPFLCEAAVYIPPVKVFH